jgi:hypothetical protein
MMGIISKLYDLFTESAIDENGHRVHCTCTTPAYKVGYLQGHDDHCAYLKLLIRRRESELRKQLAEFEKVD